MRTADSTPFARPAKSPGPTIDTAVFAASILITLAVVGHLADVAERTGARVEALAAAFVLALPVVFGLALCLVRGDDPRALIPPSR